MKIFQRCGTRLGYFDHRKNNTPACRPCLDSYAAGMRAWRHRTGRSTHTLVPDKDTK